MLSKGTIQPTRRLRPQTSFRSAKGQQGGGQALRHSLSRDRRTAGAGNKRAPLEVASLRPRRDPRSRPRFSRLSRGCAETRRNVRETKSAKDKQIWRTAANLPPALPLAAQRAGRTIGSPSAFRTRSPATVIAPRARREFVAAEMAQNTRSG